MIRPGELVTEAALAIRGRMMPALLIAALAAAMCVTVLLTQGRSHAAAEQILSRLDAAGARALTVSEVGNNELVPPQVISTLSAADSVQAAAGLSVPRDVTNGAIGPGGDRVPAWDVTADLDTVVQLADGRWPRAGEAIVDVDQLGTLGLRAPVGFVTDNATGSYPVVGSYQARPDFPDLDGVLIAAPTSRSATLRVVVASVSAATVTQQLALSLLRPADPQQVRIQSPTAMAELQQAVGADLGGYTGAVTVLVSASGTLLIGIIVLAEIFLQAADLGRRRALGADRRTVIALVVARAEMPAAVGALVGTYAAVIVLGRAHTALPWTLVVATVVLALCAAMVAAIPPAMVAAYRDPVRVLRTP